MVTGVDAVTALVFTVNVALLAPETTVTLAGTVAVDVLLERETAMPPLGAGPLSVTVPVEVCAPPVTLVGFSVSEERVGGACGSTVSEAVLVTPANDAEIVTGADVVTAPVLTVNVALLAPAATVTLAGTVAAAVLSLERETAAPPLGAGPLRVTVPVDGDPPVTLVGLSAIAESVAEPGGVTVSEAVLVTPAYDAEIVTGVDAVTALVLTVNVALLAPAATVTLAGTVAVDVPLLDRETATPLLGAGPLRVTVPVDGDPPVTLVGLSATEDSVAEPGGVTVSEAVLVPPP